MKRRYIEERCIREAKVLIEGKLTVRAVAKLIGISKSTVYKDISERLPYINGVLYIKCLTVLEKNKAERHIRGGKATRDKWLKNHSN